MALGDISGGSKLSFKKHSTSTKRSLNRKAPSLGGITRYWLLFVACLCLPVSAWAEVTTTQSHSTVTLVFDHEQVKPGANLKVGLDIQLEPNWHTYWKNPGDSGTELQVDWKLPEGVTASPLIWPTPQRINASHLTTFGYEGRVLLSSNITIPPTYSNDSLPIEVKANWLVCDDICIPGKFVFASTIKVGTSLVPSKDASLFENQEHDLPRSESFWKATYQREQDQLSVRVESPELKQFKVVDFYPFPSAPVSWDPPKINDLSEGVSVLTFGASDRSSGSETIQGLLIYVDRNNAELSHAAIVEAAEAKSPLLEMLLLAFLGGLILNLMPCVFPIISIKLLAILNQSKESPLQVRVGSLSYAAGVIVSFWALAGALLLLRESGPCRATATSAAPQSC